MENKKTKLTISEIQERLLKNLTHQNLVEKRLL